MTKGELLDQLQLLSALESWGFCGSNKLPDHLIENILMQVDVLRREILKEPE